MSSVAYYYCMALLSFDHPIGYWTEKAYAYFSYWDYYILQLLIVEKIYLYYFFLLHY